MLQQFIDGQNLLEELQQQGTFSEAKIRHLLQDLLNILKVVHQYKVIHRDIKPENIIQRGDGKVVLIDFGASKLLTNTVVTGQGTMIGSFGYASLEQMQGGEAYPASDLYSLGATCFHLLSGIHPWELWKSQGYGWVKNWKQYLQQPVSHKMEQIFHKLLQEDYQQRYQSAEEVLQDLNSQPIPPTQPVISSVAPTPSVQPTQSPKNIFDGKNSKQLFLIAIPLLMLIGAGTIYFLNNGKAEKLAKIERYNSQGIEKYNKQDFRGAIQDYNQAIQINPDYALAYYQRGLAHSNLGDEQEAIKDFRQAAELFAAQGNQSDAKRSQGVVRSYLKDYQGAIAAYSEAIGINSKDFRAYVNRGNARKALKNNQTAIEDYKQAIKINPDFAIAHYNLCNVRNELRNYQSAIEDCNQAIRLNPNYRVAYYQRGLTHYELGDKQAAIEDYTQAIKINPNYVDAYYNRGIARSDLGDNQAAIEDYTQAIKINPNYVNAYISRGLARSNLGDNQAAIEDYSQAIKINPNYALPYYNRGVVRSGLGNKQGAIEDYTQAIRINPNYVDAYNNRGVVRSGLGNKQAAIEDYNQAIKINSKHANAHYNRGNARNDFRK